MPKEKKYQYKLWLQVERQELDSKGLPKDGDKYITDGGMLGVIPEEMGTFESMKEALTSMATLKRISDSFDNERLCAAHDPSHT